MASQNGVGDIRSLLHDARSRILASGLSRRGGVERRFIPMVALISRAFRQRQAHLFRIDHSGKVGEHLAQRDDLGRRRQLAP